MNLNNRFSENAKKVLARRYLSRDEEGKQTETIHELFERVAKAVASAENNYSDSMYSPEELTKKFYKIMTDLEFLPNSPTLMNAGKALGQLSACFVLPVEDSMEGIFDAVKNSALIHKSGGGTGFSFSKLRPAKDIVSSTSGVSSGPVSFMKVFNTATETIKQGGTRRGANMGILRVDHPDILEFITCKENNNELTNFNISVAITDKFTEALDKDGEYELINPRNNKIVRTVKASKVFNMIVDRAWRNGEPGVVFIDRINKQHPLNNEIEATNPCGEQPLLPYESCNLGSINLSAFIKTDGNEIDFDRLREVIDLSVRFLDNVIDINKYPLEIIEKTTKLYRKIGLGVMGWADTLIKLNIPYNSELALEMADKLMGFVKREAWSASQRLAKERAPFSEYNNSLYAKKNIPPLRNATVTTVAPTGTISLISGCSSGIEPLFAVAYEKQVMDNEKLVEVHKIFVERAKEQGFYSDELMQKIASKGSLESIDEVPDEIARVFVTSHQITPEWHIRMQAAFQKHTDNAVSKTVNFPFCATQKDVETVFKLSQTLGCKGVTVYRDGSREHQVLNIDNNKSQISSSFSATPRPRPEITVGATERVMIGCGNLYVTVNSDEQGICEVFTSLGRGGGCPSQSEAAARLASMALRAGVDVQEIIDQLKGIRCMSTIKRGAMSGGIRVLSCPDAIGKAIEQYHKIAHESFNKTTKNASKIFTKKSQKKDLMIDNSDPVKTCPDCGENLEHEGGCVICKSCGYSKCG